MIEKEVRGFLNKDDFDSKLVAFEQKFGVPKKTIRFSKEFLRNFRYTQTLYEIFCLPLY